MRPFCFLLVLAAATSLPGFAQQPTAPPKPAELDEVLDGWEKAMTSLSTLHAEVHRTTLEKVFKNTEVFKGVAKFVKSTVPTQNSRASLELYLSAKEGLRPDVFEKYICSGNFLYEYSPANKVIRVHEVPPPGAGKLGDDNLLNFLFGMKAADAKKRYQLSLDPAPAGDTYYHYLKAVAVHPQDKAEFTVARLVLLRSNFMPRQVWFHSPNGNETTWDFPRLDAKTPIPLSAFEQPQLPPGWQWERMQAGKLKVRSTNDK